MLGKNNENPTEMPGIFISFEGIDGSGKTTQLRMLAAWLKRNFGDDSVIVTRQPGGTAIGDRIRELLLDSKTMNLASKAELALFFADRAQVIAEVIDPALASGKFVLCDRWTDSTEAYQAGGRGLGSEIVLGMHRMICGRTTPDLTILLDTSIEASLNRARRRNGKSAAAGVDENRFETERNEFHHRTLAKYLEIAARDRDRVRLINGDLPIEVVHSYVVETLRMRLIAMGRELPNTEAA